MARRGGLGRGLGALIPPAADETPGVGFQELPVSAIAPNPRQPRSTFDEEALTALAASIRELGVLQPVLVRPSGGGTYELVAGERRWRAAKRAGLQVIPRTVRLSEAPSYGQSIITFDPTSRGAIAYRELAKEVSRGPA